MPDDLDRHIHGGGPITGLKGGITGLNESAWRAKEGPDAAWRATNVQQPPPNIQRPTRRAAPITEIEIAGGAGQVELDGKGKAIVTVWPQDRPPQGMAAAASVNPFTIQDATSGGVLKFSVAPGYIEVLVAGLATYLMPTLGGTPLNAGTAPTMAAVSGPVYAEITLDGTGTPTAATIGNATTIPDDTATLRHVQIGVIDTSGGKVVVSEQDIDDDIPYVVPAGAFAAQLFTSDADNEDYIAINAGQVLPPLTFPPGTQVGPYLSDPGDTYAWLAVTWSSSTYTITGATIDSGSAWPNGGQTYALPGGGDDGTTYVPLCYIDPSSGVLVPVTGGNIMLHRAVVTGGFILAPVAL